MENFVQKLTEPRNLYEHAEAVAYKVLDDPAYFKVLRVLPEKVKAAALNCFMRGDAMSYDARLLRYTIDRYNIGDTIDTSTPMPVLEP